MGRYTTAERTRLILQTLSIGEETLPTLITSEDYDVREIAKARLDGTCFQPIKPRNTLSTKLLEPLGAKWVEMPGNTRACLIEANRREFLALFFYTTDDGSICSVTRLSDHRVVVVHKVKNIPAVVDVLSDWSAAHDYLKYVSPPNPGAKPGHGDGGSTRDRVDEKMVRALAREMMLGEDWSKRRVG